MLITLSNLTFFLLRCPNHLSYKQYQTPAKLFPENSNLQLLPFIPYEQGKAKNHIRTSCRLSIHHHKAEMRLLITYVDYVWMCYHWPSPKETPQLSKTKKKNRTPVWTSRGVSGRPFFFHSTYIVGPSICCSMSLGHPFVIPCRSDVVESKICVNYSFDLWIWMLFQASVGGCFFGSPRFPYSILHNQLVINSQTNFYLLLLLYSARY